MKYLLCLFLHSEYLCEPNFLKNNFCICPILLIFPPLVKYVYLAACPANVSVPVTMPPHCLSVSSSELPQARCQGRRLPRFHNHPWS